MRRVNIDPLLFHLMPVYTLPIYICTEEKFMIGVDVGTHKILPSAMDNASGY